MILIKNINVYAPENLGKKDILIGEEKILLIKDEIKNLSDFLRVKIINGEGKILTPGFIDPHVHITGGGGEASFKTRVPEIMLSKLTKAGITTVCGLLGTDGTTRSVENLVAKAKALNEEGITAYAYTGSYEIPCVTLTESVRKDITFISEIIGAKIAISDHRSSAVTEDELARVASDVRVANMLSGKNGGLVVHMGNGSKGLSPIMNILKNTDIPVKVFRPTHINRDENLVKESFEFAKKGGIIDLTCGLYDELSPANLIEKAEKAGVNLENITISSDGYGSWSKYDEFGKLLKIGASSVQSLQEEFVKMVNSKNIPVEKALQFFTSNTAKAIGVYPQKGCVSENSHGDLLIFDKDLNLDTVIAMGKVMIENGEVLVKGTYED